MAKLANPDPPEPVIAPTSLPVLAGHRLAGKVQRQRIDAAAGIDMDAWYAATGLMLDVPTARTLVMTVIADALYDAFGDAVTIDKFPSADFVTGMNAYGYEEDLDPAAIDWCGIGTVGSVKHADDCPNPRHVAETSADTTADAPPAEVTA